MNFDRECYIKELNFRSLFECSFKRLDTDIMVDQLSLERLYFLLYVSVEYIFRRKSRRLQMLTEVEIYMMIKLVLKSNNHISTHIINAHSSVPFDLRLSILLFKYRFLLSCLEILISKVLLS